MLGMSWLVVGTMGCTADTGYEKLIRGMGGSKNFEALEAIESTGTGTTWVTDQGTEVGGQPPSSGTYSKHLWADVRTGDLRIEYERQTLIPFEGSNDYAEIVQGERGYLDGEFLAIQENGPPVAMTPDRAASTRRVIEMLHPHLLVAAFIDEDPEDIVADIDGQELEGVEMPTEGPAVRLYWNEEGDLVSARTTENHYLRGDVQVDVRFAGWTEEDGGLRFPTQVDMFVDGARIHQESRSTSTTEPSEPSRFEFPIGPEPAVDAAGYLQGLQNAHFNYEVSTKGVDFFDGPRDEVVALEIAPGLTLVGKDEYFSFVIEQENNVVLMDPSLYPQRVSSILDHLDTDLGKPLTHVVLTHFHKDHSGGLRAYLQASDPAVVVSERALPFHTEWLNRPATVTYDAPAGFQPTFVQVDMGASISLPDAIRPIDIYQVSVPHSDDSLIMHLPNENITLFADMYNSWQGDSASAVVEAMEALGIADSRVAFVHGNGFLLPPGVFGNGPPPGP